MKYSAVILAASALAANAQVTYNNGTFTCPASNPNGAYCASDSLGSSIIIRCSNGVGQPGNCADNLAGQPPATVLFAECYQSSATAGDAACSKNCVVYPPGGAPFTLPASLCTPSYSSSNSTVTSAVTSVPTGPTTVTSTGTAIHVSAGTTITETFTTTFCPESTLSTAVIPSATGKSPYPNSNSTTPGSGSGAGSGSASGYRPSASGTGSSPTGSGNGGARNGTVTGPTANGAGAGTPTATPIGPSTAAPSSFTGGAITNTASAALAVVGLAVAIFL